LCFSEFALVCSKPDFGQWALRGWVSIRDEWHTYLLGEDDVRIEHRRKQTAAEESATSEECKGRDEVVAVEMLEIIITSLPNTTRLVEIKMSEC
jgi:hypothetical protein